MNLRQVVLDHPVTARGDFYFNEYTARTLLSALHDLLKAELKDGPVEFNTHPYVGFERLMVLQLPDREPGLGTLFALPDGVLLTMLLSQDDGPALWRAMYHSACSQHPGTFYRNALKALPDSGVYKDLLQVAEALKNEDVELVRSLTRAHTQRLRRFAKGKYLDDDAPESYDPNLN